jgi:hypothetical protein
MKKIAYNAQHGGFSLSDKAIRRYAEIKGIKLYPEKDPKWSHVTYWTVPASERPPKLEGDAWYKATQEERIASNKFHSDHTISNREIPRDDPVLIQVIEELGAEANGSYASLAIAEIAPGTKYRIDEYDGAESVMTIDDYEWSVA